MTENLTGLIETVKMSREMVIAIFICDGAAAEKRYLGRSTTTLLAIQAYLQHYPVANTIKIKEAVKVSLPTVLRALGTLEALGIIKEITGKERHKVFAYHAYLEISIRVRSLSRAQKR